MVPDLQRLLRPLRRHGASFTTATAAQLGGTTPQFNTPQTLPAADSSGVYEPTVALGDDGNFTLAWQALAWQPSKGPSGIEVASSASDASTSLTATDLDSKASWPAWPALSGNPRGDRLLAWVSGAPNAGNTPPYSGSTAVAEGYDPGPTQSNLTIPSAATAGTGVSFYVQSNDPWDGVLNSDPETITWDFGDGTNATGEAASHTYTKAGTYIASVTSLASDGASTTTTQQVVDSAAAVTPPPPPPPPPPAPQSQPQIQPQVQAAAADPATDRDGDTARHRRHLGRQHLGQLGLWPADRAGPGLREQLRQHGRPGARRAAVGQLPDQRWCRAGLRLRRVNVECEGQTAVYQPTFTIADAATGAEASQNATPLERLPR